MSEKTTLLPTAPTDERFVVVGDSSSSAAPQGPTIVPNQTPRFILAPGLEFDPARKYRYGMHSLAAAILVLASFILVELRDCNFSIGADLDRLQALHLSMMVFAFVLYLLSLFGIADYIFQFKFIFLLGVLVIYTFTALMFWMTYEAAVSPCIKTFNAIPVDISNPENKNVFTKGDGVGIIVLFLDIFATLLMLSAAGSFYKRY